MVKAFDRTYRISLNRGLGFYFLRENFDPASKRGRLLFKGGLYLPMSVLVSFYFKLFNFNHTYRHLKSGQRVRNNLTMKSVVLHVGCHISKAFWTLATGGGLLMAQENAIKHDKYGEGW